MEVFGFAVEVCELSVAGHTCFIFFIIIEKSRMDVDGKI
jgi:hypothetical protein